MCEVTPLASQPDRWCLRHYQGVRPPYSRAFYDLREHVTCLEGAKQMRSHRSFDATRILFGLAVAAMLAGCGLAGTATPNASASQPPLLIDTGKLITWEVVPDEITGVLVMQKLQNIGTSWIQIAPRDSTYEIKSPDNNVIANSNFRRAYPTYLAPGETGYLIDDYLEGSAPIENITNLTVNARFRDIPAPPTRRLEAKNTNMRQDALPGGVYVTGEAENTGTAEVLSGHVGAVFYDSTGAVIGASTTDLLEHVLPGEREAFETRPSNPLDITAIADYDVFASPTL